MTINLIDELENILIKYGVARSDVCLLSSSVFAVKDLRGNRDIEFAVRPSVRDALLQRCIDEVAYNEYSEVIMFTTDIHCHKDEFIMFDITDDKLFTDKYSSTYGEYRIVDMDIYLSLKILQNRRKDDFDIEMIKSSDLWTKDREKNLYTYLERAYKNGWDKILLNREEYWRNIFVSKKNIYLFGTGSIGRRVYNHIKQDGFTEKICGFLVSDRNNNPKTYQGKPVYSLAEIDNKEQCFVIVAVLIRDMAKDKELLRAHGYIDLLDGFCFMI